ncbi:MAG: carbohydrate kinase [Planctomycetes bacterium]|nr:carbohydrate kinase [Planctomycetota bacterium]
MAGRFQIVGLGEALFDVFPDAQVLGGAPLNVAVHAHQLAAPRGGAGIVVSRVGQDALGDQVIAELQRRGMTTEHVQRDPDRDTGKVYVGSDARGQPTFEIASDVAWDWVQFDFDAEEVAQRCEAVCFGTLAQRNAQSRNTIYRFLDTARRAFRMFDVNLRQNFYDRAIVQRSCESSNIVKLNDQELPVVAKLLALPGDGPEKQIAALIKRYALRMVVLTRGAAGTVIHTPTDRVQGEPVSYPSAPGADAVGAGDACAAAILLGLVQRWPLEKVVALANHAGAFVASQPGATPALPESILKMVG